MNKITRIGIDIGKNVFHLCAVDRNGKVIIRMVLKRNEFLSAVTLKFLPGTKLAMEACGGAHHWARELNKRGFSTQLIAPQFVKPYVRSNKTDSADAEAIAEAMSRPEMRFVPIKNVMQQDIQATHRIRSELIKSRTALINQIRGLVAEFGLVAPRSPAQLRRACTAWLDDSDNSLSVYFRQLLLELREDLRHLDGRIEDLDAHLQDLAANDPVALRLQQLRGIGPVCSTILSAALGNGSGYKTSRDFVASLGLVPRQHSTGGRERLLGISKRGDGYIRKQMIHGARAVVANSHKRDDALSQWVTRLKTRKHSNVVTVALAAKTARMAWALVSREVDYEPALAAAAVN